MPYYSKTSIDRLNTCNYKLKVLFQEVIKYKDCTIVCGFRNEEDQNKAFKEYKSKLRWPYSRHNHYPSNAIDVVPYPTLYSNINQIFELAGVIKTIAKQLNIAIEWGGEWKTFKDYPHWEVEV